MDDYTTIEETRRQLPTDHALCRRCLSVGVPDDRYLCNACTQALNPPEVRRAVREEAVLLQVMRQLQTMKAAQAARGEA